MDENQLERIGKVLKQKRNKLGYTQEVAAELAQISYSYYTKIENGKQLPSLEVAVNISKAFHLSLDKWLFGDTSEISEASPEYNELIKNLKNINVESIYDIQDLLSIILECTQK